ncbi:MAG: YdcF family protein [Oscillospiraceae bacterium]|nr:YdcF family protein [Oscillospiraceae bacterium]
MKNKPRKHIIIRTALLLIGLLSLANVTFLYLVANPTMGFHLQLAISIGLIVYAICFNWISKKIHIAIGLLALIPIAFVLFLFIYGNVSNVDYNEDVVIVLGAGIHGETVSRPLARRLDAAIDYWNRNPDAYIVVTGGLGNRATITEAEAMARYLIRRGVPAERILLEELSTSTYENLVFAKEILDEHFPDGWRAAVITNDFHIYRSVRTARAVGIDAGRIGAYTEWYTWPVNYLREMLAVVQLWVGG